MTWIHLDRPELGVMNSISQSIRQEKWRRPNLLDPLRGSASLFVGSDYAGEHREAKFHSLTYLLVSPEGLHTWDVKRTLVRRAFLNDGRRMSFKSLRDRRRLRALSYFLEAANALPGLLVTFLVEKKIGSLFREDQKPSRGTPNSLDLRTWRPRSREKLLRIMHFGALLVSGVSTPVQDLLWVTDQDDIVANSAKHAEATEVFARISGHYLKHGMGRFRFATTESDDGARSLEDFVAIADLTAGSLAEICSFQETRGQVSFSELITLLSDNTSWKSRLVFLWLGDNSQPLRRLTFILKRSESGGIDSGILRPHAVPRK